MNDRKKLSAAELIADVRAGLSDADLMAKHGLGAEQLQRVFVKLIEAGKLTASEIQARNAGIVENDEIDLGPEPPRSSSTPIVPGPPIVPRSRLSQSGNQGDRSRAPYQSDGGWDGPPDGPPPEAATHKRKAIWSFVIWLVGILTGMLIQGAGAAAGPGHESVMGLGALIGLLSLIPYMFGCYHLVKMKGYGGAYCLLGLIPCCVGLLIVLVLPNKYYPGAGMSGGLIAIVVVVVGIMLIAIVGIVLAIAIPNFIAYKRTACDTAAQADLAKLTAAIEKFRTDRSIKECPDAPVTPDVLQGLAGPYYGWGGTSAKCGVRIRVEGDEIQAFALSGSQPLGHGSRFIYRVKASGGPELPAVKGVGPADAREYRYAPELTESMVKKDCSIRTGR